VKLRPAAAVKNIIRSGLRGAHAGLGRVVRLTETGRILRTIPDAGLYRPLFEPWRSPQWRARLREGDNASVVSLDRKYVLWQTAAQAAQAPGDFMECGVYKGGTAYLLATVLEEHAPAKRLHLFDTFAGMPETRPEHDLHVQGDFDDTSLEAVSAYLAPKANVSFHPGLIPASFAGLEALRFSFVHIDLDIYEAIRDASAFAYERVAPGGFLLYDDYGFPSCPGARRAVDEFYAGKPERPLVLATGQCLVVKA
jgi:O-methyltransferase